MVSQTGQLSFVIYLQERCQQHQRHLHWKNKMSCRGLDLIISAASHVCMQTCVWHHLRPDIQVLTWKTTLDFSRRYLDNEVPTTIPLSTMWKKSQHKTAMNVILAVTGTGKTEFIEGGTQCRLTGGCECGGICRSGWSCCWGWSWHFRNFP